VAPKSTWLLSFAASLFAISAPRESRLAGDKRKPGLTLAVGVSAISDDVGSSGAIALFVCFSRVLGVKMLISTFCLFVFHKQQMLENREREEKKTEDEEDKKEWG
jgi:hypothetical protein